MHAQHNIVIVVMQIDFRGVGQQQRNGRTHSRHTRLYVRRKRVGVQGGHGCARRDYKRRFGRELFQNGRDLQVRAHGASEQGQDGPSERQRSAERYRFEPEYVHIYRTRQHTDTQLTRFWHLY